MFCSKCLVLAALLLFIGAWNTANGRYFHQRATADAGHTRSVKQLLQPADTPAIQAVLTPRTANTAVVPAEPLLGVQPAAVEAGPIIANKLMHNTTAVSGYRGRTATVATPAAAASASIINYPTPATAAVPSTVAAVPAAPAGFLPPGFAAPAAQQPLQPQQLTPTAAATVPAATVRAATAPAATAAVNATVPVAADVAGQQSAWSAGGQQAAWVVQDPMDGIREGSDVAPSGTPPPVAPSTPASPPQPTWSSGWNAHSKANDLLLSTTNDHQDERAANPAGSVQITVLHYNDWHVRVEPTKESYCALCAKWETEQGRCSGGLARMAAFVKQQRQQDPDLLLLNAGDDFIGTEWDRKVDIAAPAAFMNLLGPDAMTIGNHEWDKGLDTLKRYFDKLNTTKEAILGANIDFGGHQLKDKVQRHVVKYVKGKKVCIFGLTTQYALPDNDHMWPVKINEPYNEGRKVLKDMEGEGCQATILLSHLGYTSDLVAAKVLPGLDVVIGGHSHSFLWPDQYNPPYYYMGDGNTKKDETWGPYPTFVHSNNKDVPVVQASWGSRYMGKLVLTFDPESQGGKLSNVHGEAFLLGGPDSQYHVQQDQEALDEIAKWRTW